MFAEGLFPRVMGLAAAGTATAEPVLGQTVTSNFFTALGSPPARGRVFADGDESAAVLNHDYWRRRFSGDDSVVGRTLRINGRLVTVVGVAAPGSRRRDPVVRRVARNRARRRRQRRRRRSARPDVSVAAAAAEVRAIGDAIDRRPGAETNPAGGLNALPFSRAGGNRNVVFRFAAR